MTLLLLNGAPGSGKSTLAQAWAAARPGWLCLDVDQVKFALPGWADDLNAAGLEARRLTLQRAGEHLQTGGDVVIGQYLARTPFVEQLADLAELCDQRFVHLLLQVDEATLRSRLAGRLAAPERPEHAHNNTMVGPDDAPELIESLRQLAALRPEARWVDATGDLATTLERVAEAVSR